MPYLFIFSFHFAFDDYQGKLSGLPGGGAIFAEALTSQQHLLSILEEDFIELDDLA